MGKADEDIVPKANMTLSSSLKALDIFIVKMPHLAVWSCTCSSNFATELMFFVILTGSLCEC